MSAKSQLIKESANYKSITLNGRQLCDLELLLNGGFYPLTGFLKKADYESVVNNCRLANGKLWSMPIVLPVKERIDAEMITLKDEQGVPLAILKNPEFYKPDLAKECQNVYGTTDRNHPYVKLLMEETINYYVGGDLIKIQLPLHYDFEVDRLTPDQTKQFFKEQGWNTVVGFQTRNPMHRSHMELTLHALRQVPNSKLLLHPVVGITQECDVDYHTRVRCYKELINYYPENTAKLALLPLSMRMAGPREALWHAQIRQNYGCTHFVVGRDHAGPSYKDMNGKPFYGPYDAHNLLEKYADELEIKVVKSQMIVYVEELKKYLPANEVPNNMTVANISGTDQRRMLTNGEEIPEWFSFPKVVEELRKDYVPLDKKGFCLYFVGLSGSGKSTIANAVKTRLLEIETARKVSVLDGDVIRTHLSKGLGFSKADRSTNVQRIGYVASEIVKHNGIVLCANIAPYIEDRNVNRRLIGQYYEIYVKTTLEECENRDVKGLYKMARDGKIKEFTGISDPFEEPVSPELVLDGTADIETNLEIILNRLRKDGYLRF